MSREWTPRCAVVIPATIGGVLLTAIWGFAFAGLLGARESALWDEISGTGWRALMIGCYVPSLFWGPLQLWLTHSYARRRRTASTRTPPGRPPA